LNGEAHDRYCIQGTEYIFFSTTYEMALTASNKNEFCYAFVAWFMAMIYATG